PDTPYCNYVSNCDSNMVAAGGVVGMWRQAGARVRAMKPVQVEQHLSASGALSAQRVPIKQKTDAAFLYALIHRILIERDWREVCDVPFLERMTNAPYLIGPNGYYLRDPETLKPLVWDRKEHRARPFSDEVAEPLLEGSVIASGVEIG